MLYDNMKTMNSDNKSCSMIKKQTFVLIVLLAMAAFVTPASAQMSDDAVMTYVDCPKEWIDKLFANGQVATQYCDFNGNISMDEEWNVNGSYASIEGITSPDGRCLGKMAHVERRGDAVAMNIYGEQDMKIFESGVKYFK